VRLQHTMFIYVLRDREAEDENFAAWTDRLSDRIKPLSRVSMGARDRRSGRDCLGESSFPCHGSKYRPRAAELRQREKPRIYDH